MLFCIFQVSFKYVLSYFHNLKKIKKEIRKGTQIAETQKKIITPVSKCQNITIVRGQWPGRRSDVSGDKGVRTSHDPSLTSFVLS